MTAKKTAKPEDKQVDLQAQLDEALAKNAELESHFDKINQQLKESQERLDSALDLIESLRESKQELEDIITDLKQGGAVTLKQQMLMAMLPQVRIDHAHPDAQKAFAAVGEIMETWGLNDIQSNQESPTTND